MMEVCSNIMIITIIMYRMNCKRGCVSALGRRGSGRGCARTRRSRRQASTRRRWARACTCGAALHARCLCCTRPRTPCRPPCCLRCTTCCTTGRYVPSERRAVVTLRVTVYSPQALHSDISDSQTRVVAVVDYVVIMCVRTRSTGSARRGRRAAWGCVRRGAGPARTDCARRWTRAACA